MKLNHAGETPDGETIDVTVTLVVPPWSVTQKTTLSISLDDQELDMDFGPEGTVFAIGKDKKPQTYLETEEEHILCVAVDNNGSVYVSDTGNNRIQKFSSTGTYVSQWGSEGSGDGQFTPPMD